MSESREIYSEVVLSGIRTNITDAWKVKRRNILSPNRFKEVLNVFTIFCLHCSLPPRFGHVNGI